MKTNERRRGAGMERPEVNLSVHLFAAVVWRKSRVRGAC